MVQRRRAHVPAPRVETGAALPCWKADPSITMVCGMEIGVAGEGVPQSHMLGGLLGPASAQERGPGASQARWGGGRWMPGGGTGPSPGSTTPSASGGLSWCQAEHPPTHLAWGHIWVLLRAGFTAPQLSANLPAVQGGEG